jgi:hypothetical protein
MVRNKTYLDQIKNNRIIADDVMYMLSPLDLENLNPGCRQ